MFTLFKRLYVNIVEIIELFSRTLKTKGHHDTVGCLAHVGCMAQWQNVGLKLTGELSLSCARPAPVR